MDNDVVLVVDDDADTLELHRIALEDVLEVPVVTAETGEEALVIAQERQPALILLDIMLPGMDGLEVARRLKGSSTTKHIPIIAVTASATREQVLALGCDDYVQKPFQLHYLLRRVRAQLPAHEEAARRVG